MKNASVSAFGLLCLALTSFALPAYAGSVEVSDAMAYYKEDNQNGARYQVSLKIVNTGTHDRLYAVRSRVAERAMISQSNSDKNKSVSAGGQNEKHLQTTALELPAGATVALNGADRHIMLMKPKKKLEVGDRFSLTLFFEKAGRMKVDVRVVGGEIGRPETGG